METHEYNEGPGSLKVGALPLCGCGRPYEDSCHSKAPEMPEVIKRALENGDAVHAEAPEKKCDNNCLTFIKNGFCLHTGYLEAPETVEEIMQKAPNWEFEAPTDEVEKLSATLHDIYIKEAKRQGDVRHKDAYEDLTENIKEFDRVLARHIIELLQKEREKGVVRGRSEEAMFCYKHNGGGFAAGKSEAFSLVRKAINGLKCRCRCAANQRLDILLKQLSTLEGK